MGIMNFIGHYAGVKFDDLDERLVNAIANGDPDGVAETAIRQKMEQNDLAVKQLAEAQAAFRKENAEYENLRELVEKKKAGMNRMASDLQANPDNQALSNALAELMTQIEGDQKKLAKEKSEADSAKRFMDMVQQTVDANGQDLKSLREAINEVKRATEEAKLAEAQHKKEAEQAEVLAGLRKNSNKFDTALTALKKRQADAEQQAEEYRIKAEQLSTPVSSSSSLIDSYLDSGAGKTESLAERLARLNAG